MSSKLFCYSCSLLERESHRIVRSMQSLEYKNSVDTKGHSGSRVYHYLQFFSGCDIIVFSNLIKLGLLLSAFRRKVILLA